MKRIWFYILLIFLSPLNMVVGQNIDSLEIAVKMEKNNHIKLDALIVLSRYYSGVDTKTGKSYAGEAIELATEIKDSINLGWALNYMGSAFYYQGDYDSSRFFHEKALAIRLKTGDKKGLGASYNNLASIFGDQGNSAKATEYLLLALKYFEEIDFKAGVAIVYNGLGVVYYTQKNFDESVKYYKKSIEIHENMQNYYSLIHAYNNLGIMYHEYGKLDSSLIYYHKSMEFARLSDNKAAIIITLSNIAAIQIARKEYHKAEASLLEGVRISEETGDAVGMITTTINLGLVYSDLGDIDKAEKTILRGIDMALEQNLLPNAKDAYLELSSMYYNHDKYLKAYEYHVLYSQIKDTILNEQNSRIITEMQTKFDTEKKEQEIKLLEKEDELNKSQMKKQRIVIYTFIIGFLFIITFSIIVFRLYRQKKKANIELALKNDMISQQKEEIQTQKDEIQLKKDQIEEIHLELKDSIKYAQRIQSAMLPDDRISNEIMPEHFVLFKPRDIVSGDFYWMTAAKDRLIVAAADCTGHGVPGAFMSMLGISFLNEIVNKEYISDTGNILSNLRSRIIQSLKQKGEFGEQKDGMDIAMFSIDMDGLTASFSGANNPLYLIREGSPVDIGIAEDSLKLVEEGNKTLYEVAPDKMPIAIYEKMNHFKVQQIRLQKGDILYVFSDGFADQFGGPNGKKFKYKPFKQLLLNISDNSMSEQRGLLDSAIETWKAHIDETTGKKFEQVDDIVIVGVRI